jgi:prepilin-type N-terminal cleavage/methylation domain-containing protein
MKKINNGFSLVELLVVISIIGIISVVGAVAFSKAQKEGRDRRRIDDLKTIQSAAEQYYFLNGRYPTSIDVAWTGPGNQMILAKFPTDPNNINAYTNNIGGANSYCVCTSIVMENIKNSNSKAGCNFLVSNGGYFCVQNQQ